MVEKGERRFLRRTARGGDGFGGEEDETDDADEWSSWKEGEYHAEDDARRSWWCWLVGRKERSWKVL